MAASDRDLILLSRALRVLDQERESAARKIGELFELLFEGENPREFRLSDPGAWDAQALARGLHFASEIVVRYVQLYHDPRELPVTHSKRQKRVAIHLDQQLRLLLREAVVRAGADSLREDDGTPATDDFLDEPILFLKQEARARGFPRTKKGGGASLRVLRERFAQKLEAKGVRSWEAERSA
jgi:hypothetical protein